MKKILSLCACLILATPALAQTADTWADAKWVWDEADANKIARSIANSPLVKTAFFGCDPNLGRIAMAAGKAGRRARPRAMALSPWKCSFLRMWN